MAAMEPTATASGGVRAIVLAGGAARRLGGVDKLALTLGGIRLLDRVLAPLAQLGWPTIVVGPRRVIATGIPDPVWACEEPAGGGPAFGLAAGLAATDQPTPPLVAVLAGDLPHLRAAALTTLSRAARRAVAAGGAGALAVDDAGIDQLLLGVWSTAVLRAALPGVVPGASLRSVLNPLRPVRVRLTGAPAPWSDCDTEADLAQASALLTVAGR
jgi:molybdopterin-guanine dinucleotide biosynthesis protein A